MGLFGWNDIKALLTRLAILVGDLFLVAVAFGVAYLLRFHFNPFIKNFPITKGIPPLGLYTEALPIILVIWGTALYWQGAYKRLSLPALDESIRIGRSCLMGILLSMSAMFVFREGSYSRLVFSLAGLISFFLIYFYREGIKVLRVFWVRRNRRPKRVLILGTGYMSNTLKKILERHGDRAVLQSQSKHPESIKKTIIRSRINEVLLANPEFKQFEAVPIGEFCEQRGVTFRLLPNILEIRMGEVVIDESLGIPTFQIKSVSLHGTAFITKRFFDLTLATLFMGMAFVPLLIVAILIKLTSPGSVFYSHERMGFKEHKFEFMKFRTMIQNADDLLKALVHKSDRHGPVFKMKKDPRVTPVGSFLRRFSFDEIPQLINILRGEMSLVGPRPQVLWEAANYDIWAKKRLNVLPGITGLWQVSGRAELTYEEMIDMDIFYIEHWSPGLDLKILFKTIPAVLTGKGAY